MTRIEDEGPRREIGKPDMRLGGQRIALRHRDDQRFTVHGLVYDLGIIDPWPRKGDIDRPVDQGALQLGRIHRVQHQFDLGMAGTKGAEDARSEEHTSELQSLMRISYAVFCLKKKTLRYQHNNNTQNINTDTHKQTQS